MQNFIQILFVLWRETVAAALSLIVFVACRLAIDRMMGPDRRAATA